MSGCKSPKYAKNTLIFRKSRLLRTCDILSPARFFRAHRVIFYETGCYLLLRTMLFSSERGRQNSVPFLFFYVCLPFFYDLKRRGPLFDMIFCVTSRPFKNICMPWDREIIGKKFLIAFFLGSDRRFVSFVTNKLYLCDLQAFFTVASMRSV